MTSSQNSGSGIYRSVSYTVNEKGHWIGDDGKRIPNPNDPIIQQHLIKRVSYSWDAPTKGQKAAIRRILNWPALKPFLRCRGKNRTFVAKCEKAGDHSHSGKDHLCTDCQCIRAAGWGTKGDFYGLGPETGHLGVGFCENCAKKMPVPKRLKEAREQMKALQTAGHAQTSTERWEHVRKEEAEMSERSIEVRKDMELIEEHLTAFKRDLEAENLTEYAGGKLKDMSDKTRHELILRYAKTISDLNLSHFKMDKASYIHFDEIAIRLPRQIALGRNLFSRLKEALANWKPGDRDPLEVINEEWVNGLKDIWRNLKHGV